MNAPRSIPGFFSALLLLASAASGAEGDFYGSTKWQDAQKAAAGARLVVVVRVTEAGKPAGKGWDGNMQRHGVSSRDWKGEVEVKQEVSAEITSVLRGTAKHKKLKATLGTASLSYQKLSQHWRSHYYKRGKVFAPKLPASDFALAKGGTYVLFLGEPREERADGDEKRPLIAAVHVAGYAPAKAGDSKLLKSVTAFCRVLRAWERPPKLPAEEEAGVRKLIKQLGHEDFGKRGAADKALRTMAFRIRPLLAEAAKGRDLERATAAEKIIKDFTPVAGKTMYPDAPAPAAKAPAKPPEKKRPNGADGDE
jgi:hypothetical protein